MLRIALRNLWDHKLRSTLLGLAVVAGVGFVTASYIFTDSLSLAFDQAFAGSSEGVDIQVRQAEEEEEEEEGQGARPFPRIDAGLVEHVAEVEGVESARPFLQAIVTLVIEGEEPPSFGPPDFAVSWSGSGYYVIEEGRAPSGPDEAVIDVGSAENRGVAIGDEVRVAGATRAESFTVVGIFGFAGGVGGLGPTFLGFTFERTADLLGAADQVNAIEVTVGEGADLGTVLDRLNAVLPAEVEAVDSRTAAAEQAAQLQDAVGFFNTFLLVFGAIALVVGAFVVYNAFRVVVAQRGRELALLRVLGTTRGQLVFSVLNEAIAVGIIASVVGLGAGIGLAVGIRALLAATGSDLPDAGLVLTPRTALIGITVGMATTLLSALAPALRTTRISPMEALRELPELRPVRRWWAAAGALLLAAGVAIVSVGVARAFDEAALTGNTDPLILIGVGCLVAFASFFLLARVLVRPVLGLFGRGAVQVPSVLGRENARRTPRRTATTASALMIGLGLVATVAVLSSSVEDTILQAIEEAFSADVVVQPAGFDPVTGIPVDVAAEVASVDGVADVARLNMIPARLPDDSGTTLVVGVEPETVALAISFEDVEGSFADLGPGKLAVQRVEADKLDLELGDMVELVVDGATYPAEVVAIFDLSGGLSDTSSYYLSYQEVRALQDQPRDASLAVGLETGADFGASSDRISRALADFPGVSVSTVAELGQQIRSALAALVGMVAGLLLMSVAVAVMGIVLTLYLAVFERTRETGLLRAVGMTRRQVRRMIRFESVLIALFGTMLGVVLGLFCGWALSVGVVGEGVRLGIPWVWILLGLVAAVAAGMVAAIIPARRASRMDVLTAIAYE